MMGSILFEVGNQCKMVFGTVIVWTLIVFVFRAKSCSLGQNISGTVIVKSRGSVIFANAKLFVELVDKIECRASIFLFY